MNVVGQFAEDLQTRFVQISHEEALKMAKGQCEDFAEYRYKVGFIKGMERASEETELLRKKSVEDDE